jgi:hypothetical protein
MHSPFAGAREQPRALEHAQMLRDRGQRHPERLGKLPHTRLADGEARQNRPARTICQGREHCVELPLPPTVAHASPQADPSAALSSSIRD